MRRAILIVVTSLSLILPGVSDARSLERKLEDASLLVGINSGSAFDALAENIADTAARAVPIVSSSAGFTYRYNAATEVFERTSQTLGPLYLERPDTLGQGKFNVSVSFQYVELNEFDGTSLKDLESNDPIVVRAFDASGNPIGFRATRLRYSLGLQNYVTAVGFTYGVTDDLDVNLYLPIMVTNMRVGVHARDVATAGPDAVFTPAAGPERVGHDSGDAVGVGDILLRAKYQLPRWDFLKSALGLQLRLPSGQSIRLPRHGRRRDLPVPLSLDHRVGRRRASCELRRRPERDERVADRSPLRRRRRRRCPSPRQPEPRLSRPQSVRGYGQ
jgi:hypothetical protein